MKTTLTTFDFTAYPIIRGAANIEKLIKDVSKKYTAIRPLLHQALLSAVLHAVDTNDTTLVTRFWNSLGNEINKRNGVATWLNTFTNLQLRKGKDAAMQWLKPKKEAATVLRDETTAKNTPFYDMPKVEGANNSAPFSLFQSLERLLARAENLATSGKLNEVDKKELADIERVHKAYKKKQAETTAETPEPALMAA